MNDNNNKTDNLEETFDTEQYTIPDKWMAAQIVVQSGIVGILLYLIGITYSKNNEIVAIILFGAIPFAIGGILFYSWRKAKTDTSRQVLKISLIFLAITIVAIILITLAMLIGLHIIHEDLKNHSGGGNPWL